MRPYVWRVRRRVPITDTPSTDGVPYNTGPAMIVHPLYAAEGWTEGDTSRAFHPPAVYSRPYVAVADGRRAGAISAYFDEVDPGGVPVKGLQILRFAKAERIDFKNQRATAVHYTQRASLNQKQAGTPGVAHLRRNALLILAAGALATPRLLLLSGVGPRGREAEILPEQKRPAFVIDNTRVGVGVHVM